MSNPSRAAATASVSERTTAWKQRVTGLLGGLVGRRVRTAYRRRDLNLLALHGLAGRAVAQEDERAVAVTLEQFRRLAGQLSAGLRPGERRAIGIASPEPRNGATLVASNVATTLAHQHPARRVLLTELNWRSPCLRASFSPEDPIGLRELLFLESGGESLEAAIGAESSRLAADPEVAEDLRSEVTLELGRPDLPELYPSVRSYLSGESDLESLAVQTPLPNLSVHLSGGVKHGVLQGRELQRLPDYVSECSKRFDFVIADLPPVLAYADAELIAPCLDAALLVCRAGVARRRDVRDAVESWNGAPLLGCVLNDEIRGLPGWVARRV